MDALYLSGETMVDLDDPFSKPNMAYLQISISSPIIYSSHASPVYFRSQKAPDNVMILFSLRFRHNLIPPPPFFFPPSPDPGPGMPVVRFLPDFRPCHLFGVLVLFAYLSDTILYF